MVVLVTEKAGLAIPTPETSLNTCQKAVKTAAAKFVSKKVAAIGTCLQAISVQMVKNNAVDASAAASSCVKQFRLLNDSRSLGKSLPEKLSAGIAVKCAPGGNNTHALGDILGVGAGVSQPLNADDLNAWCSHHGGDGSIDTLQEWSDCISAATECDVDAAIAAQYPRVLDWLALVKPSMQALTPPVSDPNKITDAVAGLDAVKAAIDGPDTDNVVSIQCGGLVSSGTAAVGDVLSGKTFSNDTAGGLTGTMPNQGAANFTPGAAAVPVPAGYYSGGQVNTDASLVSGNIKSGATIFGVAGSPAVVNTSTGTATAADMLSGKVAFVNGSAVTGSVPAGANVNGANGLKTFTIPDGLYAGSKTATANDTNLAAGNIKSGTSIFGVSGSVVQASGNAAAGDVLTGKTFSNASGAGTGTMPNNGAVNITPGTSAQTVAAGYHNGSGTVAGDADLVASNIVSGVNLFGVTGTALPAQTLKTGQTTCYDSAGTVIACAGTRQDGDLQKGVALSYTVDNVNGTITDTKTGLMWEKLSDDGTVHDKDNTYTWTNAFAKITTLNTANYAGHNDWRLPNIKELETLANFGTYSPALDPVFNTACAPSCTVTTCSCDAANFYWSSTSLAPLPNFAWIFYSATAS